MEMITMNNVDKIRTKIAALLAKNTANGATEAEAEMAMARAQQMMDEYGVTLNDVTTQNVKSDDFVLRQFNDGVKLSVIDSYVASAIGRYTDTKVWNDLRFAGWKSGRTNKGNSRRKTSSNLMFYGFAVDVELAEYIYKTCENAMETEWKIFSGALPVGARKTARKSFMIGMAVRLRERLDALKAHNVAKVDTRGQLVVIKRELVERAAREELNLDRMKKSSGAATKVHADAFTAGKIAGEKVRFNHEVQNGPTGGVKLIA
jgi:hypothetical protein